MLTEKDVLETLKGVRDPETEMNIVELALVKDIILEEEGRAIKVSLAFSRATPNCPACGVLAWYVQARIARDVERTVKGLPGVERVTVLYN